MQTSGPQASRVLEICLRYVTICSLTSNHVTTTRTYVAQYVHPVCTSSQPWCPVTILYSLNNARYISDIFDVFVSELNTTARILWRIWRIFNIRGSVHRNNILIQKSQQVAHVTDFILSDDYSTCFEYHYHPSSGAQNNCNYSIWVCGWPPTLSNQFQLFHNSKRQKYGVTVTRWCSYSCFVLLKMGDNGTRNM